MNNIIICEGSTDYYLLQYYMREALDWNDDKQIQSNILKIPGQKSRNLIKDSNILTIMSAGGCSRLTEGLNETLTRNYLTPPDLSEMYSKIIIVTDRDEHDTENDFIQSIQCKLDHFNVSYTKTLTNNNWISCEMKNQLGIPEKFDILLLVIPFEKNGAMETFLLDAISAFIHEVKFYFLIFLSMLARLLFNDAIFLLITSTCFACFSSTVSSVVFPNGVCGILIT